MVRVPVLSVTTVVCRESALVKNGDHHTSAWSPTHFRTIPRFPLEKYQEQEQLSTQPHAWKCRFQCWKSWLHYHHQPALEVAGSQASGKTKETFAQAASEFPIIMTANITEWFLNDKNMIQHVNNYINDTNEKQINKLITNE